MLFLVLASIGCYILFYWLLNIIKICELYGLFIDIFVHDNFYFAIFFMGVSLIMVDIGLYHAHEGVKFMIELQEYE